MVCGRSQDDAEVVARLHPSATGARAYCADAAHACVVVAVWTQADRTPPRAAQDPPSRLGAFDHWLDFTRS